jgi:hypothetical protein
LAKWEFKRRTDSGSACYPRRVSGSLCGDVATNKQLKRKINALQHGVVHNCFLEKNFSKKIWF